MWMDREADRCALRTRSASSRAAARALDGRPPCCLPPKACGSSSPTSTRPMRTVPSECSGKAAQAIAIAADVASAADVKRMIAATVERFRRLDVLVNNAGYGIPGSVVETDEDAWDALMAVNVRGVFL